MQLEATTGGEDDKKLPLPEGEGVPRVQFRPATEADIDLLLEWDEQAKIASVGEGFTPGSRQERRQQYESFIKDPRFAVLIITLPNVSDKAGMVVVDTAYQPKHEIKILGEPFAISSDQQPLPREEIQGIMDGGSQRIAHGIAMTVDKQYRGQGIGTQTGQLLEEYLRQHGVAIYTFYTGFDNKTVQQSAKGFTLVEVQVDDRAYPQTSGRRLLGIKKL